MKPLAVIHDNTPISDPGIGGGPVGCLPRRTQYGASAAAIVDEKVPLIEYEDFPRLIREQEANASSLWHIWKDSKIGAFDQNPLSYCWGFSSVAACALEREIMGLPFIPLSPSSVAAPVVGYVDKGWYIEDALKRMTDVGVASTDYCPQTTCDGRTFKKGWIADANKTKVTQWFDIRPGYHRAQGSMLLTNRPLVGAFQWWRHAILLLRIVDKFPNLRPDNPMRYAMWFLQSWGKDYGQDGVGELQGTRACANEAYAVKQTTFVD